MNETLRPSTLGEILDRTAQLYRRNFWLFAGVARFAHGVYLRHRIRFVGALVAVPAFRFKDSLPRQDAPLLRFDRSVRSGRHPRLPRRRRVLLRGLTQAAVSAVSRREADHPRRALERKAVVLALSLVHAAAGNRCVALIPVVDCRALSPFPCSIFCPKSWRRTCAAASPWVSGCSGRSRGRCRRSSGACWASRSAWPSASRRKSRHGSLWSRVASEPGHARAHLCHVSAGDGAGHCRVHGRRHPHPDHRRHFLNWSRARPRHVDRI